MKLGNRILELIKQRNMNQKDLAVELNIAPTTLNGYITNYREPDISMLCEIADYFDITLDYLIGHLDTNENSGNSSLSENEQELVNLYRCLNEKHKDLLIEQGKLLLKYK